MFGPACARAFLGSSFPLEILGAPLRRLLVWSSSFSLLAWESSTQAKAKNSKLSRTAGKRDIKLKVTGVCLYSRHERTCQGVYHRVCYRACQWVYL